MKKFKEKSGITLVALVITIIVLLILAGVTIAMVFGDNGILNRAKESSDKTKIAQALEEVNLLGTGYHTDYQVDMPSSYDIGENHINLKSEGHYLVYKFDYTDNYLNNNRGKTRYSYLEIPSFDSSEENYGMELDSENKNYYLIGIFEDESLTKKQGEIWIYENGTIVQKSNEESSGGNSGGGNSGGEQANNWNNDYDDETNVDPSKIHNNEYVDKDINSSEATQKALTLSAGTEAGGEWNVKDSSVVTVDQTGTVTWKKVGTTKVVYVVSNEVKEVYNIVCRIAIPNTAEGWSSIHDCGSYGDSYFVGGQPEPYLGSDNNNIYAACNGNGNVHHCTIYRTVNLTNVNQIKIKGYYYHNAQRGSEYYYAGIADDPDDIDANLEYDEEASVEMEFGSNALDNSNFDVNLDVSSLTGSQVLAFTAVHGGYWQMTVLNGYTGTIYLCP